MLQTAERQLRTQQQIAAATTAAVAKLWRRLTPEFSADWGLIKPQVADVLHQGRAAAVAAATGYVGGVLAETGQGAPPVASLNPGAFLVTAPDGRSMDTLVDEPIVWTKTGISRGESATVALERAGRMLTALSLTVLADTRREVYQADIVQRPRITGYVRMLNPPSCSRCVILAGRWYRWNAGFQRHPRCDCQHIPATENVAGDLTTDPYAYFGSLSKEQQDRLFGKADARAIRDGADIYRVVNVRGRGLATPSGARRYGTPSKLTIDDITRLADGDRARAIELMRSEGYILDRGQAAVPLAPGVRTDAQILAAGRGRGMYRVGGQTVTTARAQRYDAVSTGVRDPLARATMTAAERRLYDAAYRLQYARRNGVVPRSVGANSADAAAGARGVPATPDRLEQLRADLEREIARIRPGTAQYRLYQALGLDDEATAQSVFDTILRPATGRT